VANAKIKLVLSESSQYSECENRIRQHYLSKGDINTETFPSGPFRKVRASGKALALPGGRLLALCSRDSLRSLALRITRKGVKCLRAHLEEHSRPHSRTLVPICSCWPIRPNIAASGDRVFYPEDAQPLIQSRAFKTFRGEPEIPGAMLEQPQPRLAQNICVRGRSFGSRFHCSCSLQRFIALVAVFIYLITEEWQ